MLLLTATTDKLQLVTSAAATVDVHASYVDASNANPPVIQGDTMGRQNTAITTAATTDIVAAPGANDIRNVKTLHIRNKHATLATDVTVNFNQNGTIYELHKATLRPNSCLEYIEGVGFMTVSSVVALTNKSVAAQGPGFATDTYLTGSNISIPSGAPVVGTLYRLTFAVTKTAAGTATPILIIRYGTNGSTADTARLTFTWSVGTAATDTAHIQVNALFRTVGSGASAVLQGVAAAISQPTTGFSSLIKSLQVTSGGFDSTVASSIIGASYNGGASAAHTVQLVTAELVTY